MGEKQNGPEKFETVKEKLLKLLNSEYLMEHEKNILKFILYQEETKNEQPPKSKNSLL